MMKLKEYKLKKKNTKTKINLCESFKAELISLSLQPNEMLDLSSIKRKN
jgi:hypothetical protein